MARNHDDPNLDAEGILDLDLETPINDKDNDIDEEDDMIASLVGDDASPSAEEAAMHITDQP